MTLRKVQVNEIKWKNESISPNPPAVLLSEDRGIITLQPCLSTRGISCIMSNIEDINGKDWINIFFQHLKYRLKLAILAGRGPHFFEIKMQFEVITSIVGTKFQKNSTSNSYIFVIIPEDFFDLFTWSNHIQTFSWT